MSVSRPSLTLALLQAREAAMGFFRPSLNEHGLTEQQWRVIRILREGGEMEVHCLAELACILKPSMTGMLNRLERDGLVTRRKSEQDQRRVFISLTNQGQQCFLVMVGDMEKNYRRILQQFGEDKLQELLRLLSELKQIEP